VDIGGGEEGRANEGENGGNEDKFNFHNR
jgi:hypothetical protein